MSRTDERANFWRLPGSGTTRDVQKRLRRRVARVRLFQALAAGKSSVISGFTNWLTVREQPCDSRRAGVDCGASRVECFLPAGKMSIECHCAA